LDRGTLIDLPVSEPKMERVKRLNKEMLETLAKSTGGKFLREETSTTFPTRSKPKPPKSSPTSKSKFWTSPLYYA